MSLPSTELQYHPKFKQNNRMNSLFDVAPSLLIINKVSIQSNPKANIYKEEKKKVKLKI